MRYQKLAVFIATAGVATIYPNSTTAQDNSAQHHPQRAESIIYRDAHYRGPAVNVSRAQENMRLAWPVNSIRVKAGRWQLCEQPHYRGHCRIIDRDSSRLGNSWRGISVQSMRPLGWNPGDPGVPGTNRNLRGMAAQFYPAPASNGYRVLACATGSATSNCAAATADRFCAAQGWRTSAREALQTVNGRVYLADVLCTNTGR